MGQMTPVECLDGYLVKRDDLWEEGTVAHGGKARAVGIILRDALKLRKKGIATVATTGHATPYQPH